jgi:hypothetical protein
VYGYRRSASRCWPVFGEAESAIAATAKEVDVSVKEALERFEKDVGRVTGRIIWPHCL